MIGCCVEVHGLAKHPQYNGCRGTVRAVATRWQVVLQSKVRLNIKPANLCVVFCLGVPRECRFVALHADPLGGLRAAVDSTRASKFYVLYLGETEGPGEVTEQHFVLVRTSYFKMARDRMRAQDKETLLRVYVSAVSQDDPGAKICFSPIADRHAEAPCVVDLSCERLATLAGRDFSLADASALNVAEVEEDMEMAALDAMIRGPDKIAGHGP